VQAGAIADFNTAEGYRGPGTLEELQDWSPQRILRPEFLEALLLQAPYHTAIPRHGIRIRGAWFTARLDLSHMTLAHQLWLEYSRFESEVCLIAVRTPHWFSLEGSALHGTVDMTDMHVESHLSIAGVTVTGTLNMNTLHVGGNLLMRDHATLADVDLIGAHIEGYLDLTAATVAGTLTMNSLYVGKDCRMSQGATFAAVDLTGAQIERDLDLTAATVAGMLTMNNLHVGQGLFMRQEATFAAVDLIGAQIEGQLDLTAATVAGTLTMNNLHVGQGLFMRQGATFAAVDLTGAHIEGQLDLTAATVAGTLTMNNLHVGQGLFMRNGVFAAGKPEMTIELYFATIDGILELSGASLPSLNLAGTRIGGDLRFAIQSPATWERNAQLHLYNTEVVGMQDVPQSSPTILRLEGFTYGRLAALTTATALTRKDQKRLLDVLTQWLERQQRYSPQPYEQLASVVQKAGYKRMGLDILYRSKRRERRQTAPGLAKAGLWLSQVFIGYGYHNFWVLWSVIGFCLLGCAVLYLSGDADKLSRPSDVSPASVNTTLRMRLEALLLPDHEWPWWPIDATPPVRLEPRLLPYDIFPFSVSMLLPIIKLNKKHDDIVQHLPWGVRYYFYFHQIVGYVLASFLVAGLAGLTKKE